MYQAAFWNRQKMLGGVWTVLPSSLPWMTNSKYSATNGSESVCVCVILSCIGMPKVCHYILSLVNLLILFLYLQGVHTFQSRRAIFLNNVHVLRPTHTYHRTYFSFLPNSWAQTSFRPNLSPSDDDEKQIYSTHIKMRFTLQNSLHTYFLQLWL
jgi:hypothetical protein